MSRLLPLIVMLVFSPTGARAAFIEMDLNQPGDGLVTRDTEAGLDWLDVPATQGKSFEEIVAGDGGWTTSGWRHADTNELCSMAMRLAPEAVSSPCPNSVSGSSNENPFQQFHALLGLTVTSPPATHDFTEGYLAWAGLDYPPDAAVARFRRSGSGTSWDWVVAHNPNPHASSGIGHFLVRPVPEPSTALLVTIGLVGLTARRARRPQAPLGVPARC